MVRSILNYIHRIWDSWKVESIIESAKDELSKVSSLTDALITYYTYEDMLLDLKLSKDTRKKALEKLHTIYEANQI